MSNTITEAFYKGFLWSGLQTIGSRLISLVTQLILAWLLLPEDFGKISIATSLTSIVFLIQALGLTDVLVSRGHMYFKILDLAKSLAFITSIICLVFTIITAFIGGVIYDDITITYLILIFCSNNSFIFIDSNNSKPLISFIVGFKLITLLSL